MGSKKQRIRDFSKKHSRSITSLGEMVRKRQFHTASVFYRKKCIEDLYNAKGPSWDTFMWCWLAVKGPIWYDNRITCAYRKAGQGVTNMSDRVRWIKIVEGWSNILYDEFSPKYITHTDAYLRLSKDILNTLRTAKQLSANDREELKQMYDKYSNFPIKLLCFKEILMLTRDWYLSYFHYSHEDRHEL